MSGHIRNEAPVVYDAGYHAGYEQGRIDAFNEQEDEA